jgi:hypothetical protein
VISDNPRGKGLPPFEPVCILGIKLFQRASRLKRNNAHRSPLRPGNRRRWHNSIPAAERRTGPEIA